jgi:hypothetical protein
MKKSIFLLCALSAPAISQATPTLIYEPSEVVYLVDIIVNKGEEIVSYSTSMLSPMRYGGTATATFGGKTVNLKYSGAASVEESNGKTTRHSFLHVTEENRFIANIYRSDYCGEMAFDEAWPLSHQEYHVTSETGDCTLTLRYRAVNAGKL